LPSVPSPAWRSRDEAHRFPADVDRQHHDHRRGDISRSARSPTGFRSTRGIPTIAASSGTSTSSSRCWQARTRRRRSSRWDGSPNAIPR
jgi:hypothetical protein